MQILTFNPISTLSLTMMKFSIFKMPGMCVDLKLAGVSLSFKCTKTPIPSKDYLFMKRTKRRSLMRKEISKMLFKKLKASPAYCRLTLSLMKKMKMHVNTFTTKSLNITEQMLKQEAGSKEKLMPMTK